jgi:hypothetical protein
MPPEYGIAQFYDQVYGDDPLKPLLPTSLDKMRSSNFNTDKLQSIFPTSGIMTNVPFGTSIDNFQGFTDKEECVRWILFRTYESI